MTLRSTIFPLLIAAPLLWQGAQGADLRTPTEAGRPIIGTVAYSDGCNVTHAWEDGSAIAYCADDGVTYVYDPDGNLYSAVGNPIHEPGWYVCADNCLRGDVDYAQAVNASINADHG
jgi:hypothetical protein